MDMDEIGTWQAIALEPVEARHGRSGSTKPRVTVVVPCYNAAPFLRATLESVLCQSLAPCEVLVIDDGSTDQSAAIAESFGPPVRVVSQKNQGESIARNRGIDEARGDWIAFLDADDLWRPDKLARQLAAARPDVACIHTNYSTFGTSRHRRDLSKTPAAKRYTLERLLLGRSTVHPSTLVVPKALTARFPTWTQYAEDAIYLVEVARLGKFVLVPDFLTAVRCHRASQSAAPGIAARWHATFEEWLRRNGQCLDVQTLRSLRRQILGRLVHQAYKAHYRRDESEFRLLCDYLTRYAEDPAVQRLLDGKMPSHWSYAINRRLGKLKGVWRRWWTRAGQASVPRSDVGIATCRSICGH